MKTRLLMMTWIACWVFSVGASNARAQSAKRIVDEAAFHGGVVVHVGCGDGAIAREIHELAPNSLVHGLERDPKQIQQSRLAAIDHSSQGKVTFGSWDGVNIPFVDGFVNLLLVDSGESVTPEEVDRVLTPGGMAVFHRSGKLETVSKARPSDIDEWPHYLYDTGNNPVSKDKRIKPPLYHLQWVGSPRWSRHHDVMSSVSACVSADNKIYYIFDEGSTYSPLLPPSWKLIARDAFNGTILWKRDLKLWFPNMQPLKNGPATLPRRLVAAGNRVFATLEIDGPVSILDANTGQTLHEVDNTKGTEEILFDNGSLYLVMDRSKEKEELTRYPIVRSRSWHIREKTIASVDVATGTIRWEHRYPWVAPLSLSLDDQHVYFHDGDLIRAVEKATGEGVWESESLPIRQDAPFGFGPSLVVKQGVVMYTGGENDRRGGSREQMYALSAKDGSRMWEAYHPASGYRSPEDLFVINGKVWRGDVTAHRWDAEIGSTGIFYGTDVSTGDTSEQFSCNVEAYWFHHRCHMAKATENYLLTSRTGIELIDLKNQEWNLHHWVRGACLYGIMPANGMVYAPQHPCACYMAAKLYGFNALKPKGDNSVVLKPTPEAERLTKGPAFAKEARSDLDALTGFSEWPTYRRDNGRSGATPQGVVSDLKLTWKTQLPAVATQPVVVGGKVLVSLKEQQALYAMDAESGDVLYRYFPGGRIDSPPTVAGNRIYFGSTDGSVYCLDLDDGELVWKYQAAPTPAHHMYFERIESTHPVHGTVLVRDEKVYTVSGRSMFTDGGMRFLVLDAKTGEKVAEHVMDDRVPGTDEPLQMHHEFLNMPVALPDILSSNDEKIFMRFQEFDLDGNRLELAYPRKLYGRDVADKDRSTETLEDQKGTDAHVFSGTGFLDDSWWHRTYWIYGRHFTSGWPGYYLAGRTTPAGRVLSFDQDGIFGWGRLKQYFRWSKTYEYMLFSSDYDYQTHWARAVPILVRAMVKADDQLYALGPRELIGQETAFRAVSAPATQSLLAEQDAALRGQRSSLLLTLNTSDGQIQSGYELPTIPVFDGMSAAGGRLYISLTDGSLVCLGEKGESLSTTDQATIADLNAKSALPEDATK